MSRISNCEVEGDVESFKSSNSTITFKRTSPRRPAKIDQRIQFVGRYSSGKTCLSMTLSGAVVPLDEGDFAYIPTAFDPFCITRTIDEVNFEIPVWDCQRRGEDDNFYELNFQDGFTVIVFCFSLADMETLNYIREVEYPFVKKKCPKSPFVLLGLKNDIRKEDVYNEGTKVAKKIGAREYLVCSALKNQYLKDLEEKLFTMAFRFHYGFDGKKSAKNSLFSIFKKSSAPISLEEMVKNIKSQKLKEENEIISKKMDEFAKQMKLKKFVKIFSRLSHDVILNILHNFVFTVKILREYDPVVKEFQSDFPKNNIKNILLHFYGYFPGQQRQVQQLFYCFAVQEDEELKILPKKKQLIFYEYDDFYKCTKRILFSGYYSDNPQLIRTENVPVNRFKNLLKNGQPELVQKLNLKVWFNERMTKDVLDYFRRMQNVTELVLHAPASDKKFDDDLVLPNVRKISLRKIYTSDLTFSKLPKLEYLKILNSSSHVITSEQFSNLLAIKTLKQLILIYIDLRGCEQQIAELMTNAGIEKVILNKVFFDIEMVGELVTGISKALRSAVVIHPFYPVVMNNTLLLNEFQYHYDDHRTNVENEDLKAKWKRIPDKLVRMVKAKKKLEYILQSVDECHKSDKKLHFGDFGYKNV